ncbi:hypothetical protein [Bacillus toyonensis]|uniref:hypothetical protein n=1 Tax=Bacillus toyonensis TaxID=155322 RepID=UPI002E1AEA77|nr:hypothetical protein [Bacillus toyonensis]
MNTEKTIFAVLDVKYTVIKSKWFIVEDGSVKNMTKEVFDAVQKYNESATTIIPYQFKNNKVEYAFGCGLTHYLQSDNVKEVLTGFDIERISVYTQDDIKNFYKRVPLVAELKKASA